MKRPVLIITCDASWNAQDDHCGWAALIESENGIQTICGRGPKFDANTSSELFAAVQAVKAVETPSEILLRSDVNWLHGLHEKIHEYAAKNFMRTKHCIMKDYDLLKSWWMLSKKHQIEVKHVKGHSVDLANCKVDRLAFLARTKDGQNFSNPDGLHL